MRTRRVYDRGHFLEAWKTFSREVATTKRDPWHRLCLESTRADLLSLYCRLSQPCAHGDVETLIADYKVVSSDDCKAMAMGSVVFPFLPPSSDSHQMGIDFAWGMYQPHVDQDSVETSLEEVRDLVKAMPSTFSQGMDRILVIVLRRTLSILMPWL